MQSLNGFSPLRGPISCECECEYGCMHANVTELFEWSPQPSYFNMFIMFVIITELMKYICWVDHVMKEPRALEVAAKWNGNEKIICKWMKIGAKKKPDFFRSLWFVMYGKINLKIACRLMTAPNTLFGYRISCCCCFCCSTLLTKTLFVNLQFCQVLLL